ncbi:hypothetical protein [Synechococcus sp. H55.8]|uniref:hypothetical protein n=2 Tax=unclassified Synechococcus TaxID=2626047 RepID=UPI0039C43ACA
MKLATSRQLWVNAFPTLAGLAVALGSLGSGGSLWQSGAAALATGMTGYLASALAGSEARAKTQLLEQSLEYFKSQQELGLQHLQNELADLRAALANWAPVRQEEEAGDGTDPQAHCELGSQIRSQQAWLAQLRAEEQNLKASIEDLQAKKQKLVQYLKEGAAKLDQLHSQRDLLAQEIASLNQVRQATGSGNFAAHPSGFGKGFSSTSTTKAAATSASANTYDAILAAIEEKVNDLDDMAKAMAELGSLEGRR